MKSLLEKIYLRLPVLLQNIVVSLYGLKVHRVNYSANYNRYYNTIKTHLDFNYEELNEYISERFIKLINDAVCHVPFYKKAYGSNLIKDFNISSIKDLQKIPLLDKSQVKDNPSLFVDERFNRRDVITIHTTGTTGTPLRVFCNSNVRQKNYAFYNRFLSSVGIDWKGKRATFGGRIVVPPMQKGPPYWRYNYFQKNLLFSSYHLTDSSMPLYIEKLKEFNPSYIDSYPSSIYTIAKFAKSNNIDLKNITNSIVTSAETLFPEQRETIEEVFGVPIYDQYGTAEMAVFIAQCKLGSYHIHTDYGIVEFLNENGTDAKPGELSEIICTSFINPVMPLIRYRVGDKGVYSSKKCACGSVFPVLEKICGRMDDVIITPDGRRVGRLSPVLKGFSIKEAQYIQKVEDSLDVLLVPDEGYSHDEEGRLDQELRKRLGYDININYKYVEKIARSKGAKLKSIISYINEVTS